MPASTALPLTKTTGIVCVATLKEMLPQAARLTGD